MSDSGHSGPAFSYQNGVWLSRNEGVRTDKFQKWSDDKTKSQMRRLEHAEHSSLVKINGDCLQIRKELRDLHQTRRQLSLHARPPLTCPAPDPHSSASTLTVSSSDSSLSATSPASRRSPAMHKSASSGSLSSLSSGYGSSLGSPKAFSSSSSGSAAAALSVEDLLSRRKATTARGSGSRGDAAEGVQHGGLVATRGHKSGALAGSFNADVAALRFKNLHSARSLSKLNNNMDL